MDLSNLHNDLLDNSDCEYCTYLMCVEDVKVLFVRMCKNRLNELRKGILWTFITSTCRVMIFAHYGLFVVAILL